MTWRCIASQVDHERETGHQPTEEMNSSYAADHDLPPLDQFNNPLVKPLAEFIEHPTVMNVLHNGATYQVRPALSHHQMVATALLLHVPLPSKVRAVYQVANITFSSHLWVI